MNPTYQQYLRAREAYSYAVQPFLKLLCDVTLICPQKYIIHNDGRFEDRSEEVKPQWAKDQISKIEACIAQLQEIYFSPSKT